MRVTATASDGKLKVRAIAGTHVVLLALDLPKADIKGLLGFAFRRRVSGGSWAWLTGLKIFEASFPNGVKVGADGKIPRFKTNAFPIQSFLWSDYAATPQTVYDFEVTAMYGAPGCGVTEASRVGSLSLTNLTNLTKFSIFAVRGRSCLTLRWSIAPGRGELNRP